MEKAYWLLQKKISFMESSSKIRKMVMDFNLEETNSVPLKMSTKAISLMAFKMDSESNPIWLELTSLESGKLVFLFKVMVPLFKMVK